MKQEVISIYEDNGKNLDNDEWYARGGTVRVPESKSAHYFIDRKVEEAIKMSGKGINFKVLELGCSVGIMTSLLANLFKDMVASDISGNSIKTAQKRFEQYGVTHVQFVKQDMENLDMFKNSTFDRIFSFSAIRYCESQKNALGEIFRVLNTNGIAVVDFPNKHCAWHFLIKRMLGIKKHVNDNLFSKKEVISLFRNAGFKNVEVKYLLFTARRLPDIFLPIFKTIDIIFEKLPVIKSLAGIIMVKGEKGE